MAKTCRLSREAQQKHKVGACWRAHLASAAAKAAGRLQMTPVRWHGGVLRSAVFVDPEESRFVKRREGLTKEAGQWP